MFGVNGDTKFNIIGTKILVPIDLLSAKNNVKLTKQLNELFIRKNVFLTFSIKHF